MTLSKSKAINQKSWFGGNNYPRLVRGFTLIELLLVIGILAVLGTITVLVINPAERLKETRDSQRLYDLKTLESLFNLSMTFAALEGKTIDLDGPQNQNACKSQANQTVFFSVPTGQGTAPDILGWQEKQAATADYRKVDGNGWVPIDFTSVSQSQSVPVSALPIDPLNTFSPDYYYTYVCGSAEFTARFESAKYQDFAAADGGDSISLFEVGSDLTLTPPLVPVVPPEIYSVTPSAPPDRDTTLSVTIAGDKFLETPTVSFSGGGITVSVNTVTENQIIAAINIDRNALSGARDVTVTNPDGGTATKAGALTINKNSVNTGYMLGGGIDLNELGNPWGKPDSNGDGNPDWFTDENPPTQNVQLARLQNASDDYDISNAVIKQFSFGVPAGSTGIGLCVLLDNVSIGSNYNDFDYNQKWVVGLSYNYDGAQTFLDNNSVIWDIGGSDQGPIGVSNYFYDRANLPASSPPSSCTSWNKTGGWNDSEVSQQKFAVKIYPVNANANAIEFRTDVVRVNVKYTPP